MADPDWVGDGRHFRVQAGGRHWLLKLDEPRPGLYGTDDRSSARLFALDHLAMAGRRDDSAFDPAALIGVEHHRGRVEATYAPDGWHGLAVRAAWSLAADADGFDLEVQVSADSIGLLRRLEVVIASDGPGGEPAGESAASASRVEPRDAAAAALSYDGRESPDVLRSLTTLPPAAGWSTALLPRLVAVTGPPPDFHYVEMVRPDDCARRISVEPIERDRTRPAALSTRYGLFGHDLEKGVVLRGRLRGIWIRSNEPDAEALRLYEEFLGEPPALGP